MENRVLYNGVCMPEIGYGTWQTEDKEAKTCVSQALQSGYRHIDTASIYGNEAALGIGIRASNMPREELFVTSKVWNTNRGYDKTIDAFQQSLNNLGLDYLDLYLIHWPCNAKQSADYNRINLETYQALIDLYKAGKVRAIGVSNFLPHHLDMLLKTEVPPMVNQIEFHPGYSQQEVIAYCQKHNIVVEAWSPLGCGSVLQDELVLELAEKYNKSAAQICIRFALQQNIVPLPKTIRSDKMKENLDVYDFSLTQKDMQKLIKMPIKGWSGNHPDMVER